MRVLTAIAIERYVKESYTNISADGVGNRDIIREL